MKTVEIRRRPPEIRSRQIHCENNGLLVSANTIAKVSHTLQERMQADRDAKLGESSIYTPMARVRKSQEHLPVAAGKNTPNTVKKDSPGLYSGRVLLSSSSGEYPTKPCSEMTRRIQTELSGQVPYSAQEDSIVLAW